MEQPEFSVDPIQLRTEAEKEAPRRGLEAYADTIRLLKDEKGFSFREIASWLHERGVVSDHNAVWRAYSKAMTERRGDVVHERIERSEQQRAHIAAMPWLEAS